MVPCARDAFKEQKPFHVIICSGRIAPPPTHARFASACGIAVQARCHPTAHHYALCSTCYMEQLTATVKQTAVAIVLHRSMSTLLILIALRYVAPSKYAQYVQKQISARAVAPIPS